MGSRPAAGGGRWVSVAPERLAGWLRGFAERHGPPVVSATAEVVRLSAPDGEVAECHVPFPPLPPVGTAGGPLREPYSAALVEHAMCERRVGVVLVRLGGYAVGVFEGADLVVSKVGSRHVQGRTAAGGWSQQRFARRRAKQAGEAHGAAAETVVRVLVPRLPELAGVVFGGSRRSVEALREVRGLAPLFALETGDFLSVPEPRLAVLIDTPRLFRAVKTRVVTPHEKREPGL
ncbi:acVLRF1 family peptidyl-tRNA hydrolase [Sinosporangium siamense]|uniref:Actinobacteria/chloroflexi VLRF1 release factor domain-containing protein n=1 Tax=Sinosporangium siamense TaxID=1367973 RepID=A0A919RHF6_9ACTN|nr:acVLRF1 family peptidyl-tRNA hydrolase [Sinosporangium siamense]GII93817.1 hypothetical protein Ssi02_40480 [Sinosporangium siamense]